MRFIWLCALAACGGNPNVSGSYTGTLTMNQTGAQLVAATTANVIPNQDEVETFSNDNTDVHCIIEGIKQHGSSFDFLCSELTCSCTIGIDNIEVTVASGAVSGGNQLSLTFSGIDPNNNAVSATFAGTLEPGTR
jgi:hypothetical protein